MPRDSRDIKRNLKSPPLVYQLYGLTEFLKIAPYYSLERPVHPIFPTEFEFFELLRSNAAHSGVSFLLQFLVCKDVSHLSPAIPVFPRPFAGNFIGK